ncbi:hypothetical protein PHBOTO_004077 [Pseudozyma hubeiensis]|nr:hypothetical protein PHBOTO_004077 [Pseudozyma hubeiensis]
MDPAVEEPRRSFGDGTSVSMRLGSSFVLTTTFRCQDDDEDVAGGGRKGSVSALTQIPGTSKTLVHRSEISCGTFLKVVNDYKLLPGTATTFLQSRKADRDRPRQIRSTLAPDRGRSPLFPHWTDVLL